MSELPPVIVAVPIFNYVFIITDSVLKVKYSYEKNTTYRIYKKNKNYMLQICAMTEIQADCFVTIKKLVSYMVSYRIITQEWL